MNIMRIATWVVVLLVLPAVIMLWASESQEQRIRRWAGYGLSQRKIAERLGISRYRVKKALAAAA